MNTLSFGVQIAGAPQAKQELREIIDMQAKLNKGNVLSGINPNAVLRSPDLLNELKRLTAASTTAGRGARGVPPIIPPPVIPRGPNFMQALLGAAAIPFSPWVGGREIGASGILGAGGLVGFGKAFLLAASAALAVRKAFELLKDSILEGAKLYQHAARLGMSTGKTAQLEFIGKALGLSPGEIDTLALRGSHPQRGERQSFFRQQDLKMILGSGAGANQLGGLQQIKNMADYATRAFNDSAIAVDSMSKNAKAMQEIFYTVNTVSMSLRGLFTDLAALLLPVIKKLAEDILTLILAAELQIKPFLELGRKVGVLPSGEPGRNRLFAGRGGNMSAGGPWERMGFVIGGFGQMDYARKTADNTAEIARHTKEVAEHMKGLFPRTGRGINANGGNGFPANYNFFHQLP